MHRQSDLDDSDKLFTCYEYILSLLRLKSELLSHNQ